MTQAQTTPPPTDNRAELPFGLTAEPFAFDTFFPSDQHLRALEFMAQVLWSRTRLGVLTGAHGCGKSTLIREFVHSLDDRFIVAAVTKEQLGARDFLLEVLRQFGFVLEESDKTDRRRMLERFLHHQAASNRVCLLIVENPQQMHPLTLEELRLVASQEVEGRRVMKVLLLGESSLQRVMESPRMAGLVAGGVARFSLAPLSEDQTAAYVAHRLRTAGCVDPDALVPHTLMPVVHAATAGVPLQINRLCGRALELTSQLGAQEITVEILEAVITELGWQARIDRGVANANLRRRPDATGTFGKLVISMQGVADREVLLDHDRILIGRGDEADAQIDSVFISRYHALVVRHDGQDLLLDLGSTNGMLFNSRRIVRRILRNGDVIQIGPAKVVYVNPLAIPAGQSDPSETICIARPGFPLGADQDDGNGTIIAFGHASPPPP